MSSLEPASKVNMPESKSEIDDKYFLICFFLNLFMGLKHISKMSLSKQFQQVVVFRFDSMHCFVAWIRSMDSMHAFDRRDGVRTGTSIADSQVSFTSRTGPGHDRHHRLQSAGETRALERGIEGSRDVVGGGDGIRVGVVHRQHARKLENISLEVSRHHVVQQRRER